MVVILRKQPERPISSDRDTHTWELIPRMTQNRQYHCPVCGTAFIVKPMETLGAAMRAADISENCDEELVRNIIES